MADYIMQNIEVSSSSSHENDPEEILVQSYDNHINKYKSFFYNFNRSALLPLCNVLYLFLFVLRSRVLRSRTIHSGGADQAESELAVHTFAPEPEERYLLKLLQKYLIKRLSGSYIVLMNDYEINHVTGNYDISYLV